MTAVVYVCFAEDDSLLYVGAATNYATRMYQHLAESPWIFDVSDELLIPCESKTEAHALERSLIGTHNPPNNWLCRSVPRPTREEAIAEVARRSSRSEYVGTALHRRCREAAQALADLILPEAEMLALPTERQTA